MNNPMQKIIEVSCELNQTGTTAASTGEKIAAAFVLNRMDYLPEGYSDIIEAWDFLGVQWQGYVRIIRRNGSYQINNP